MVVPIASYRCAHDTRKGFPRASAIRRYEDRGGAIAWRRDGAIPPGHGAITNDVQTKDLDGPWRRPFHLAFPKFERFHRTSYAHLRSPLPTSPGRRSARCVASDAFCLLHRRRCELLATQTPAKGVRRTQKWRLRSTIRSSIVSSKYGLRQSAAAAAAEMTEDSHLPALSAALPKWFREHRMPRREVLRPLENELRTAGNATVGDACSHGLRPCQSVFVSTECLGARLVPVGSSRRFA